MRQARIKYNNAKSLAKANRAEKKNEIVAAQNALFNQLMTSYFAKQEFIRFSYSTNSSNMNTNANCPFYKSIIKQFEWTYKNYNHMTAQQKESSKVFYNKYKHEDADPFSQFSVYPYPNPNPFTTVDQNEVLTGIQKSTKVIDYTFSIGQITDATISNLLNTVYLRGNTGSNLLQRQHDAIITQINTLLFENSKKLLHRKIYSTTVRDNTEYIANKQTMKTYMDNYMNLIYATFMTAADMHNQAIRQTYTLTPYINTVWRARVIEKNKVYVNSFPKASKGYYFDGFVQIKTAFDNLFKCQ